MYSFSMIRYITNRQTFEDIILNKFEAAIYFPKLHETKNITIDVIHMERL